MDRTYHKRIWREKDGNDEEAEWFESIDEELLFNTKEFFISTDDETNNNSYLLDQLTLHADRGWGGGGGEGGGLLASYTFPIYLQTTQRNYTKLELCARILLPNIYPKFSLHI